LNTLIFVVLNGLIFGLLIEQGKEKPAVRKWTETWANVRWTALENRIIYGFICGLLNAFLICWLVAPAAGFIDGLFIGIAYGYLGKLNREIRPAEIVTWSWAGVLQNMIRFLSSGLLVGLLYGLLTTLFFSGASLFSHFFFGLVIGGAFGLIVGLMSGISNKTLNEHDRVIPNQGIWNSLRNSIFLGLTYGLVFGTFFGFIYGNVFYQIFGPHYVTSHNINSGLLYGPIVGLTTAGLVWIRNGGLACTLHVLLRFLLWRAKDIPWHYPQFLDYTAERILLRKIGGGYIFVHRLLLEYFAALEKPTSSEKKSPKDES
jgi:hypothetical protein